MTLSDITTNQTEYYCLRMGCVLLLVLPMLVSCNGIRSKRTETMSPKSAAMGLPQSERIVDSVGVEVFTIRVSLDQNDLFRQLWFEVDEQMLDPALRRELIGHGMRVGFLGETLSPSLARLINVTSERTPGSTTNYGDFQEMSLADLSKDPAVTRQYLNLMPDMRAALKIFDDRLPEFSRFWAENGQLCGQTYTDALGLICITGQTLPSGKARLTIVPELEYGVMETKIRMVQAVSFQESGRPRYQYKPLTVALDLLPGQWIILGPVSRESTGAGRAFFIRGAGNGDQKIMAIRLVNMKQDKPSNLSRTDGPGSRPDISIQERN